MMKHILALGVAIAIVAPAPAAWAGSNPGNRLSAPFPSNATIYRPDCWLRDEPTFFCNVGGGLLKEEEED